MTAKQKRFCDEYLIDTNATQAAIRAGYSEKTAKQVGSRLLTYVDVKTYIEEHAAAIQSKAVADAEEVMRYLTSVVRGESESEIVVVEATGDGTSAARNIKKKPDEKDQLKAAELLGKRYGLFSDKVNISGAVPIMFTDDLGE